jgi:hypothetical protein
MRFSVLTAQFDVEGTVMYSIERESGRFAYGVRFLHTPESAKRCRQLIEGLRLIGIPHRDAAVIQPWHASITDWAGELLRTGRGLLPEIKGARKP